MTRTRKNRKKPATYASAGVHLDRYNDAIGELVGRIKSTHGPGVITMPKGFAGLFAPPGIRRMKDPVLAACSDGVGTKIEVARLARKHDTVGIDLVAMSVNDLVVTGARPLFFLDYVACGELRKRQLMAILSGIVEGCRQADCALLGGETAEMPGMYPEGEYDLAGFAVGIVDRHRMIDGSAVRPGDVILGLPSSGIHSNGFSLVRKILFERAGKTTASRVRSLGGNLGNALLVPTRIYVRPLLRIIEDPKLNRSVHGLAHITGGGLVENLPRILPDGCSAEIDTGTWEMPPVFPYLQKAGDVRSREMYRVFNMGIGMTVICARRKTDALLRALADAGERATIIGRITKGPQEVRLLTPSK